MHPHPWEAGEEEAWNRPLVVEVGASKVRWVAAAVRACPPGVGVGACYQGVEEEVQCQKTMWRLREGEVV